MKLTKEEAVNKIKELEQYISNLDWQFEDGDVFKNRGALLLIKKVGEDQYRCERIEEEVLDCQNLIKMYSSEWGCIETYNSMVQTLKNNGWEKYGRIEIKIVPSK